MGDKQSTAVCAWLKRGPFLYVRRYVQPNVCQLETTRKLPKDTKMPKLHPPWLTLTTDRMLTCVEVQRCTPLKTQTINPRPQQQPPLVSFFSDRLPFPDSLPHQQPGSWFVREDAPAHKKTAHVRTNTTYPIHQKRRSTTKQGEASSIPLVANFNFNFWPLLPRHKRSPGWTSSEASGGEEAGPPLGKMARAAGR